MRCPCPNCKSLLEVQIDGAVNCPFCSKLSEFYLFTPFQRAEVVSEAVQQAGDAVNAACYQHARNKAVCACERCGSFICSVCRTTLAGKEYCPKCVELAAVSGTIKELRTRHMNHGSQVVLYSFGSMMTAFFPAPFVLLYALSVRKAVFQDSRPERRGQIIRWAIGLMFTVLQCALLALMIYGMTQE